MLSKINNLLRFCYGDGITDKFANIEFQLFILSVKSLLPYEDKVGCMFDAERYMKEMELFAYYKNGNDDVVDYYLKNGTHSNIEDKLLEYKIIPLIIANTDYSVLLDEVIKTVLLYTTNNNSIMDAVLISSVIYEYFDNYSADFDFIMNRTRERIIEFSLKEYLEKNNLSYADKSCAIDFEKLRINYLVNYSSLGKQKLMKYKSLQFIINNLYDEKSSQVGNEALLDSFSSYLLKIRKGIINPEKLRIKQGKYKDLKEFLKNEEFVHPLLGRCTVVRRSEKEIIIKNKSGLLRINL